MLRTLLRVTLVMWTLVSEATAQTACGQSISVGKTGEENLNQSDGSVWLSVSYAHAMADHGVEGTGDAPNPDEAVYPFPDSGTAHVDRATQTQTVDVTVLYGVTGNLAVGLDIPIVHNAHWHYETTIPEAAGGPSGQSMQEVSGLGDISLLARYVRSLGHNARAPNLAGSLRISLPTGNDSSEIPWDATGGHLEPLLAPGAGGLSLGASVAYFQSYGDRLRGFGSVGYSYSFEANDLRRSPRLDVSVGAALSLITRVDLLGRVFFAHSFPGESASGNIPSSSGDFVYLAPGLRLYATDTIALTAEVAFAVLHQVDGEQVMADRIYSVGLAVFF